jgi:hypothetical protein
MRFAYGFVAILVAFITNLGATSIGHAQQGEDLREAAQNPIADLISLPFQNNTNFDIGHTDNTEKSLTFSPSIQPISVQIGT